MVRERKLAVSFDSKLAIFGPKIGNWRSKLTAKILSPSFERAVMISFMRIVFALLIFILTSAGARAEENANDDPVKSWTRDGMAVGSEAQFLNGLRWHSRKAGPYILRLGYIRQWIAGLQLLKPDGTVVLSEITPVQEYITIVDAESGKPSRGARDVNHDKVLEIAFLHQKLYDSNYHMYTVYALTEPKPKLLWKSGGKLGDWLHEAE